MNNDRTSQAFFEDMYQTKADPWKFSSSSYERKRYRATLNALRDRRYRRAFEPGCSIGVLTAHLARLCDRVEAIDISPTAVEGAIRRCASLANVHIACGSLPDQIPAGTFDLIVMSEIGYYFEEPELRDVVNKLIDRLPNAGVLLAVHWLGSSPDHVLHGDRVHEIVGEDYRLARDLSEVYLSEAHAGFRLERWARR
jgi:SAM-dependent methyltransferase